MEKLAKVHRILYVYAEQDTDVLVRCRTAAEEAINQYRRACLVAVPLTRILEKAFVYFGIPMTERVEVSEPQQGRGEEGGRSEAEEKKGSWNLIIAETEYGKVKSYGKRRHDGTKSDN